MMIDTLRGVKEGYKKMLVIFCSKEVKQREKVIIMQWCFLNCLSLLYDVCLVIFRLFTPFLCLASLLANPSILLRSSSPLLVFLFAFLLPCLISYFLVLAVLCPFAVRGSLFVCFLSPCLVLLGFLFHVYLSRFSLNCLLAFLSFFPCLFGISNIVYVYFPFSELCPILPCWLIQLLSPFLASLLYHVSFIAWDFAII